MRPTYSAHRLSLPHSTPADTRIYAVGDIHGRADLLAETIARIDDDIRRRPIPHAIEVYLGDYIDRGPDSKTVIDQLAARIVDTGAVCLRGNHETLMEEFLRDPGAFRRWQPLGALQTFASYGVDPPARNETVANLRRRFLDRFPRLHQLFLQCLRNSYCCGDFLFVHAGIRPGIAIEHQNPNDLFWIRREFLTSDDDHGRYIVHGHTPVPHPDICTNRINIDTGAWNSGTLTCIAIEGTDILIL